MLTERLIEPFLYDLETQGIEDTTPYQHGFLAGMTALSSILSDNIDNKAQLFVYLGMAISEGMQWVESQVSESPEKAQPIEFVAPRYHAGSEIDNLTPRERQPTPSSDFKKKQEFGAKVTYRDEIIPPSLEWDYLHVLDERDGNFIQKYKGKDVWFSYSDDLGGPRSLGRAVLDLSGFIQVLDISGNQIKRPYYIKLR